MADVDWTGLLQTGLDIGKNVFMGLQQQKAQRKAAKAASGVGGYYGGIPLNFSGNTGVMLPALPGFGGSGGGQSFGGALTSDILSGLGAPNLANYFGGSGGGRFPTQYTIYTTASGRQAIGGMRSLGHPMLWSGDLAAARRVGRVARKLGRFTHHRRPR